MGLGVRACEPLDLAESGCANGGQNRRRAQAKGRASRDRLFCVKCAEGLAPKKREDLKPNGRSRSSGSVYESPTRRDALLVCCQSKNLGRRFLEIVRF